MEKETPPSADEKSKKKPKTPGEDLNPEDLQKEFQELVEKKFGGRVQVLSMNEQLGIGEDFDVDDEDDDLEGLESTPVEEFHYTPRQVKEHLDRFAIGQDEAKKALAIAVCDHYNHLRAELDGKELRSQNYQKQNVLVMGPTGVGKTYLIRLISDLIGVPFVKADATRFSEVGYMGANVDDIVRDLVQKAGGDKRLAEQGIVYVDEVDKLASRPDQMSRDVSGRGVQFGFLRLLEDTDVDLNSSHDIASQFKTLMSFQKKGKADKEIVNTKNILFIFSGAFHGLEEIINKRLDKKSIGLHTNKKSDDMSELFKQVTAADLVNFGFEHEFVGRLPVRVSCEKLTEKDLLEILTDSEHSIVKQYQDAFSHYGIELVFKKKALKALSHLAHEQNTGARALNAVFEELLRPFKFELPSTDVKVLEVDENLVKNPKGVLHHLLNK